MAGIIDSQGRPISSRELRNSSQSEQTRVMRFTDGRQEIRISSPAQLGALLREADAGDMSAQSDLFELLEQHDLHLHAEYSARKADVSRLQWSIVAPKNASADEQALADWLTDWVGGFDADQINSLIYNLADAIGKGYSAVELAPWTLVDGALRPSQLNPVPGRHFQFDSQSVGVARDELRLRDGTPGGAALWPAGWIVHRVRAMSGLAGTDMLFRPVAIMSLLKRFSLSDWSEFLDGYGMPMRLGKYPAGSSDDEQRRLMWGLNQLGRHGYGVVPDGMSIELVQAVQSGAGDAFASLVAYCDKTISRAVLGSTLTSSADGGTKTNALGKVHADARHNLTVDDAQGIGGTITAQLLWPAAQLNRGWTNRARLPRFVLDTRKPADIAMYATALPALVGMGARIPLSWLHDTINVPIAADDEPMLQAPAPAAPAAPVPAPATRRAPLSADPAPAPADPVAAWSDQLARRCDPIVGSWVEQIAALVNDPSISSPADLAARLVELYGGLPAGEMSKIMQIADLTAQLTGRFEVIDETGVGGV